MELEFFWDVASPYTYLAHTRLAGLAERTGATLRYRPMLIGGVFKATGNHMPAAIPAKAAYMQVDLARWRDHYDVPMRMPVREVVFPVNSVFPMRVGTALDRLGRGLDGAAALLSAYWVDGKDVSDADVLKGVVRELALDPDAVLAAALATDNKDALRATTDEAVRRGAFGAPTFFVGEEMFWGQDRLPLVEAQLRRRA